MLKRLPFLLFFLFFIVLDTPAEEKKTPIVLEAKENSQVFRRIDDRSMVVHYGFQNEPVNFTFLVKNEQTKPRPFYLIFLWSHLDEVEVCMNQGNCLKAGYFLPVAKWPITQIFPTFPIELSAKENVEINIQIRSKNFIESEIKLVTAEELFELIQWHTSLVFSFLILIVLFLFRLVYFGFQYPKLWIFYIILFHLSILLVFVFGSGLANYYLFPNYIIPLSLFKKLIIGFLILTGSLWLSQYFQTKTEHPISHRIYQISMVLALLLMGLSFTNTPRIFISSSYTYLYLGLTAISLKLAISKLNDQLRPAPWLILSLLCIFTFEILNIFSYETFDSHDSKIYLLFLAVFLPANAFFVSRTIRSYVYEIESELTLSKKEIQKFKNDLDHSLPMTSVADKKTYLSGVNVNNVIEKLTSLMTDEKIFLEEELRLSDLSALLGLSVHQTSEILNQILKISFVDLLKKYRIEEAKRLLIQDLKKPILEIALECGFTSKSVFNESFRKYVDLTPLEFRKMQSQPYNSR